MKKIFTVLFLLPLFTLVIFANGFKAPIADDGSHSYTTSLSDLARNKVTEEIKLVNNSSYELSGISCVVEIMGNAHEMRKISRLECGEKKEFKGYYDDEMEDEFKKFFGLSGNLSKNNKNKVIFHFDFARHNANVKITQVYSDDRDIVFIVENKTEPVENDASPEVKKVTVDGETYVLVDGKAYKVVE